MAKLKEQVAVQPQAESQPRKLRTSAPPPVQSGQQDQSEEAPVQPVRPQQAIRAVTTNTQTIPTNQTYMPRRQQVFQPEAVTLTSPTYMSGPVRSPVQRPGEQDAYEDDPTLYSTRKPTSVVRRGPTYTTQHHTQPQPQTTPERTARQVRQYPNTEPQKTVKRQTRDYHPLLGIGVACLFIGIGICLAIFVPPWVQQWHDQQTYGTPRTFQVTISVGHSSKNAPQSHFIAWNDNGTIKVLEVPEGDPATYKPHLYIITTFTGANGNLIPATLSFKSVRNNGKLDMIVLCNGTQYVLYNNGQLFTPQAG